jgi:RNA polymerase sigma-70 factor, ECF subfamily
LSETILKAYERFERLEEPAAFLSYLFTIASRTRRHERAKSARTRPFSETELESFVDERNAPDSNADVDHLYAALAQLPKKLREAIVMSEITGLKLEEVASIQGASLSAVKSRVSRGRKKLAQLLGVKEIETETRMLDLTASKGKSNGQLFYHTRFEFDAKEKL